MTLLKVDDFTLLKSIFPDTKDWIHVNKKFVVILPLVNNQWLLGDDKRTILNALGFRYEIRNGDQVWIHERVAHTR